MTTLNNTTTTTTRREGGEEEATAPKPGPLSSKPRAVDVKQVRICLRREEVAVPSTSKGAGTIVGAANMATYNPEVNEESLPKKRKQGRPATTGDYERLKERRLQDQARREKEEEREMFDPSCPPTEGQAWQRMEGRVKEYLDEMRHAPIVDISAQSLDSTTVLKQIAIRFRNMKGTVKKEIGEAACFLQAALHTITMRSPSEDTGPREEEGEESISTLKAQVRELREEILRLHNEAKIVREEQGRKIGASRRTKPQTSAQGTQVEEKQLLPPNDAPTAQFVEVMDVEIMEEAITHTPDPAPALRPPIKGVAKNLERLYPPGVKTPQCRQAYDAVTLSIERLLDKREKISRGELTPSNPPPTEKNQFPQGPQSAATKAAVPARPQEKKKKKGKKDAGKNPTPPTSATQTAAPQQRGQAGPPKAAQPAQRPLASAPPATLPPPTQEWAKVVGRKERRRTRANNSQPTSPLNTASQPKASPPLTQRPKGMAAKKTGEGGTTTRKPPRTAAVTLTCPPGQYADVVREARQKIDLSALHIERVKVRRAATGALIYEIPGEDKSNKADLFAQKLREVLLNKEGVRVSRPCKTSDLRVRGLDESATTEEVVAEIARIGGCTTQDVKAGDIKFPPKSMGTLWVQCPLTAANKVAAVGKINVGWVVARIEALQTRPLQCYRCMERGHVQAACTSATDRRGACYNCGAPGHKASGCTAKTRCAPCAEAGLPSTHRAGSDNCHPRRKRKKGATTAAAANTKSGGNSSSGGNAGASRDNAGPSRDSAGPSRDGTTEEPPRPQRTLRPRGPPKEKREAINAVQATQATPEPLTEVVMEEA